MPTLKNGSVQAHCDDLATDFDQMARYLQIIDPHADYHLFFFGDDDHDRHKRDLKRMKDAERSGEPAPWDDLEGPYHATFRFEGDIRDPADGLEREGKKRERTLAATIAWKQGAEAGVFLTVNAFSRDGGKGRKLEDFDYARCVHGDDDTPKDAPRTDWPLPPSFVVESSPRKFHYYWLTATEGAQLTYDETQGINRAIAREYSTDESAKDVNRVLRVPGTWNLKPGRAPFQVRLIVPGDGAVEYHRADLLKAFPPIMTPAARKGAGRPIDPGAPLPPDEALVRSALEAIHDRCDGDYHDWMQIGFALHGWSGGSIEALEMWEAICPLPDECAEKWASMGARAGGLGIGTVLHHAKEAGWSEEAGYEAQRATFVRVMERFKNNGDAGQRRKDGANDNESGAEDQGGGFRRLVEGLRASRFDKITFNLRLREIAGMPGSPGLPALKEMVKTLGQEAARAARDSDIEWPDVGEDGRPTLTSIRNVRAWLKTRNHELRYNGFARRMELDGDELTEQAYLQLLPRMHDDGFPVSAAFAYDAFRALASGDAFDPLVEYLDRCANGWDGKRRVAHFSEDYLHVDVEGYEDTHSETDRKWFMGAVARGYVPGAKFDYMIVLQSEAQGFNKSSALLALSPHPEWVKQGFVLGSTAKETIEDTSGIWIVDAGEMTGLRTREMEAIKDQISRTHDKGRTAYERVSATVPRRFVMGGSTNDETPLQDSRNRRFWCKRLLKAADVAAIREDRDQLWGEAVHMYRKHAATGNPAHIAPDPAFYDALAELAEKARNTTHTEDTLQSAFGGVDEGWVRAIHVMQMLDARSNGRNYAEAKERMTRMGFTYHKHKRLPDSTRTSKTVPMFVKGDWKTAQHFDLAADALETKH